jgi:hypothetical protein
MSMINRNIDSLNSLSESNSDEAKSWIMPPIRSSYDQDSRKLSGDSKDPKYMFSREKVSSKDLNDLVAAEPSKDS